MIHLNKCRNVLQRATPKVIVSCLPFGEGFIHPQEQGTGGNETSVNSVIVSLIIIGALHFTVH